MNTDFPAQSPHQLYDLDKQHTFPTPVVVAGLITTALALLGVWLLAYATEDFNIMFWYFNFVIPAGAALVGIVASSGYLVASWWTGRRVTAALLGIVITLQILAYFVASYLEYRTLIISVGEEPSLIGFFIFFDYFARSFTFIKKDGSMGSPMGLWGYAFHALSIAGFTGGGVLALWWLKRKAFCDSCQVYMKDRNLGLLPAGIKPRKVKKKDDEGKVKYQEEQDRALDEGNRLLEKVSNALMEGRLDEATEVLAEQKSHKSALVKLTRRIGLTFHTCPRCHSGTLVATSQTGVYPEPVITEKMGEFTIPPETSRELQRQKI